VDPRVHGNPSSTGPQPTTQQPWAACRRRQAAVTAACRDRGGGGPGRAGGVAHAAQEQRVAAQNELAVAKPDPSELSEAEIYAMVDAIGDVGASLTRADPARMQKIYKSLRLEMVYDSEEQALDAVIKPRGGIVRVSEGGHEPSNVAPLRTAGVHVNDSSASVDGV
jgi:hypothetical protein